MSGGETFKDSCNKDFFFRSFYRSTGLFLSFGDQINLLKSYFTGHDLGGASMNTIRLVPKLLLLKASLVLRPSMQTVQLQLR